MLGNCGAGLGDLEFDWVTLASAKYTGSFIRQTPSASLRMSSVRPSSLSSEKSTVEVWEPVHTAA
jgi:hypothetical protein